MGNRRSARRPAASPAPLVRLGEGDLACEGAGRQLRQAVPLEPNAKAGSDEGSNAVGLRVALGSLYLLKIAGTIARTRTHCAGGMRPRSPAL